jgi:hypothetical protein
MIWFKNPQPAKTKNRSGFDPKVQGVYVPENIDFSSFEYPFIKEFTDTLSSILNIQINYKDSSTLTISENQIIKRIKQDLILSKEYFGDYINKIHSLNKLRFLKSITSTRVFSEFFSADTVYFRNNVMHYIDGEDTTELHTMKNAVYAIVNHDTVGSMIFSKDKIDGFILFDNSLVEIHITDSSVLVSEEKETLYEAYYTDTTLLIFEENDTVALAFYSENALNIVSESDTLKCPIIIGKIYINLGNCEETMFYITERCILRKLNSSYYLNRLSGEKDSGHWLVSQLNLDNDVLSLSKIYRYNPYNALEKLKEVTKVTVFKKDSVSYYFVDPSKREFKKFVKLDGFAESERYKRWK